MGLLKSKEFNIPSYHILAFCWFNAYVFLRDRQSMSEGGEEETQNLKQNRIRIRQHRAWCGPPTQERWDHDLSQSQKLSGLSHPGTPHNRLLYKRKTMTPEGLQIYKLVLCPDEHDLVTISLGTPKEAWTDVNCTPFVARHKCVSTLFAAYVLLNCCQPSGELYPRNSLSLWKTLQWNKINLKSILVGHLASSAGIPCDSWSWGYKFEPYDGYRDYLK